MIFNDWKYTNDKTGGKVIPNKNIPFPNIFVKYYSLSDYNKDALLNSYLYFSHPLILNDPFDSCRQLINLSKFSIRQFAKLLFNNNKYTSINPTQSYNEIENFVTKWYNHDKFNLFDTLLTIYWNLIFKDWGILSLSDIDNDLLMWSYYTDHKGFMLKFKEGLFDSNEVVGPFPINYSKDYIPIYPRSLKLELKNLLYVTNVKSIHWIHESEWRFLINHSDMSIPNYNDSSLNDNKRKIKYDLKIIDSIILGYKFFMDNITPSRFGKGKRLYTFNANKNLSDKQRIEILTRLCY